MSLKNNRRIHDCFPLLLLSIIIIFGPLQAFGGEYLLSAHGDSAIGVNATALDTKYQNYATGNCGHCHHMHASIEGVEPEPLDGPAPHALFFNSFNSQTIENPYIESDNFCFYCHGNSGPQVVNQDYSAAFGGAALGSGPQSILEASNQNSYHNLFDIYNFVQSVPSFSWFGNAGNPCSACHNSHLAKRNWDSNKQGFPLLSAISRPDGHNSLWGETELMQLYTSYEPPFSLAASREPGGVLATDGTKTPDYPGFCTSCHNEINNIWSTPLNRNLRKIDWRITGIDQDKHGPYARDGSDHFREPYASSASSKSNFVLSCMDCHEAHGSQNIMLLRRRINGEGLEGIVSSLDTTTKGYACKRCHPDDLAAGTGNADQWEYVHHLATDAPYVQVSCNNCHSAGGQHIDCGNCHSHGLNDSWLGGMASGRKTF